MFGKKLVLGLVLLGGSLSLCASDDDAQKSRASRAFTFCTDICKGGTATVIAAVAPFLALSAFKQCTDYGIQCVQNGMDPLLAAKTVGGIIATSVGIWGAAKAAEKCIQSIKSWRIQNNSRTVAFCSCYASTIIACFVLSNTINAQAETARQLQLASLVR